MPVVGVFPASVKLPLLHCSWSPPAFAVVGNASLVNTMSSKLSVQLPLLTVQRTVALVPAVIPVTVVVVLLVLVIVAVPLSTLHTPVPVVGATAAIVKVLVLH